MANSIEEKGSRFALITPVSVTMLDNEKAEIEYEEIATDDEMADDAAAVYFTNRGVNSWSSQKLDKERNPLGKKSFYFSAEIWSAPWQPKGHKPNWQEANPKQSIN
ncbi:MAG: hypothetical protein A3B38_03415 [Candidatus Levybacteria bacterium RIFCSPLOWO2_01_FULL_36_13]|nr:MAG: hypothetical protein A2684_04360 [Candidatus Levybacteria bacterium RIFCSPHIGHO2_01_FULL_36_15b]OGH34725.1 MAG: hypothetical protein A3B38_03415 [Candidatus Levybacteria bacterium RIFCSPLOWO2_01_FULL_36_13]